MSSTEKSPLPKKRASRPRYTSRRSAYLGSEIAERSAPVYRDDREAVRYFEEVVDAIGANLDRSAAALARIEAKLARA